MAQTSNTSPMRIGELAAELGLNPKTIRYYEEIGLLAAPRRTPAGYRLYGADDVECLRFISKAKAVGLTLEEIREILARWRDGEQPCTQVRVLLDHKLARIEEQLRALAEFRQELLRLRDEAAEASTTDVGICGIIEHYEPLSRPGAGDESTSSPATPVQPPARFGLTRPTRHHA